MSAQRALTPPRGARTHPAENAFRGVWAEETCGYRDVVGLTV